MNSFGTTTQQFPLIDPRCVREHRRRFRRDAIPEVDLANSYYSVVGKYSDVGWILIDRYSYNQLNPYSNTLRLVIGDFINPVMTFDNLSIVQARCVTRGLAVDPNAIYLVQVTNNEGILCNPWFQYPVNVQYNIRAPAYSSVNQNYYSASLTGANNTDAWTWNGMVQDLWGKAGGLLGTYPGLPISPDGAPEGFAFVGIPLMSALSQVLDYLGLSLAGTYPNFTIVVPGAVDAAYTILVAKYGVSTSPNYCLEDSLEYLDSGSGRVPSQLVVYFHRRNQVYGTEETVRYDTPQWHNTTAHQVTVPTPSAFSSFSSAVGTGYLWSVFTVRYDQEGNPILADVLQAQNIARDLAIDFFNRIYRGTQGYARNVYSGVLPFTTGSMVDGVRWFNIGIDNNDRQYCGWRTEVVRGYTWKECNYSSNFAGFIE